MHVSTKVKKISWFGILALISLVIIVLAVFQYRISVIRAEGLSINVADQNITIDPVQLGFPGNGLSALGRLTKGAPFYDAPLVKSQINKIAARVDRPAKNYGFTINGAQASLDLTNHSGTVLNQDSAYANIVFALSHLGGQANLDMVTEQPTVSTQGAQAAMALAQNILKDGVTLSYNGTQTQILPDELALWIKQIPNGTNLELAFDKEKMLSYLNNLFLQYNQPPVDMDIQMSGAQVVSFQVPQDGVVIDSEQAVRDIASQLTGREYGQLQPSVIELANHPVKAGISDAARSLGIADLIGTATTTFKGSTKNRIFNIKTGAKSLNDILITPGEEFSTIHFLGDVSQATGYVPELVIKGDNTIPEFGGGLCQVSTTLFRSVLNTGLPVTERENHSYRVSFYEKDGDGNYLGPGLDATIYEPHPDLKFLNDTGHNILLTNQVVGTKITFTLYGTKDGRSSKITGPVILSTSAPSKTPTVEYTDKLQAGTSKEVEFSRTGAKTKAVYEVTYADGTVKTQVFLSNYRAMPAQIKVGVPAANGTAAGVGNTAPAVPSAPPAGQSASPAGQTAPQNNTSSHT